MLHGSDADLGSLAMQMKLFGAHLPDNLLIIDQPLNSEKTFRIFVHNDRIVCHYLGLFIVSMTNIERASLSNISTNIDMYQYF